jgi:TolA-binding protein
MRRLAESYAELASAAAQGASAQQSANAAAIEAAARQKAIGYYAALEGAAPTYPQLDEVRYFEGLEHEARGDFSSARKAFYGIIQHDPQSRYVPLAYFGFGELVWVEAASDPAKLDLALQAYREVLKYPNHAVLAYAWLRTGQVSERKGDVPQARAAYRRVLRDFPGSSAAAEVPAGSP